MATLCTGTPSQPHPDLPCRSPSLQICLPARPAPLLYISYHLTTKKKKPRTLAPEGEKKAKKTRATRYRREGGRGEARRRCAAKPSPSRAVALAFARRRLARRQDHASPGLVPGPLRSGSIPARNGLEWPVFIPDWA